MNEYRRFCITRPLVAEIRSELAKEYRRIHAANPEMARLFYRQVRRKQMMLQDAVMRSLMLQTHVGGISGSVH